MAEKKKAQKISQRALQLCVQEYKANGLTAQQAKARCLREAGTGDVAGQFAKGGMVKQTAKRSMVKKKATKKLVKKACGGKVKK